MRSRADVVVVGAGIVGTSAAYELTRAGVRNVVVLDQGPLEHTGGSTFHAPGLVFHTNPSRALCLLAQWSTDRYRALHDAARPTWLEVGGIEVATTPERLAELERRRGYALACGLEAELLAPAAVVARVPLVDEGRILGGLLVSRDGLCKAGAVCTALREAATAAGAEFHGLVRVEGFDTAGGRVRGVRTAAGAIATDTVLVCTGIWGKESQAMLGVPMPLQPMQHLYARTVALPELAGATAEAEHPILRHQDRSMYFRQHADAYGIGAYRHEPVPIDPPAFTREPDGHTTAQGPFTPELFADARDAAGALMPALRDVELADAFNGHFSFSPDAFPLLGESSRLAGLYVAAGIWVTHAAGSARAVVELMTSGRCDIDLRQMHPDRFHDHATTRAYVRARGMQQYREVYDIVHPLQQIARPRGLRLTPYHGRMEEAGAVLVEAAGWERAQWYASSEALPEPRHVQRRSAWAAREWSPLIGHEHVATRERAGVFDLTPFTKLVVTGPGACAWLDGVCTARMDRPPGRVAYTTVLDDAGGIVCDLTVTRLAEDRFLVVTGGGSGPRDVAWLRSRLPQGGGVQLEDVTSARCTLGVWGPVARELVARLTDDDLADATFPYLAARPIEIGPVPVLALRISYAGELGYELYAATEYGRFLWDALLEEGRPLGAVPVGTGAFDSLRLEKGYRFSGVDMHREHTPAEAGLDFTVHLGKPHFVGREAALRERERGPRRRLCCVVLDDPDSAPLGGEPLLAGERVVGYVTSANFGWSVGKSIAYGYLPPELAEAGSRVDVLLFGERSAGTVSEEPLFDPAGERLRG